MLEIQRTLGRLEAEQRALRQATEQGFESIRKDFAQHKLDDTQSFTAITEALAQLKTTDAVLDVKDKHIRTIGRWIISACGSLVLFVGTTVVAFVTHHLQIR